MAALTGGVEMCMFLLTQTESFEEIRMNDYLTAYRATGRPPQPVPAYPTDPASRAAQGLPPLFVPSPLPGSASSTSGAPTSSTPFSAPAMGSALSTTPTNTDPTKLPISQVFTPPVVPGSSAGEKETYMSIVLVPEYAHWSPDELRYYAYARGTRLPPPGTTMIPFTVAQASTSSGSALLPPTTDGEQFQSISARPEYAGHSFEEHRIAFLKAGSELTSAQIAATFGLGTAVVDQGMDMNPPQNPLTNTTPVVSPFTVPQQPTPAVPSLFGQPAPPVAAPAAFSFGAPSQPPAPVQAATGFSFGAPAAPSQPSGFSFGTQPAAPAQPTGGFSFGQPQQTQPPAQGGFSFGTRRF